MNLVKSASLVKSETIFASQVLPLDSRMRFSSFVQSGSYRHHCNNFKALQRRGLNVVQDLMISNGDLFFLTIYQY